MYSGRLALAGKAEMDIDVKKIGSKGDRKYIVTFDEMVLRLDEAEFYELVSLVNGFDDTAGGEPDDIIRLKAEILLNEPNDTIQDIMRYTDRSDLIASIYFMNEYTFTRMIFRNMTSRAAQMANESLEEIYNGSEYYIERVYNMGRDALIKMLSLRERMY